MQKVEGSSPFIRFPVTLQPLRFTAAALAAAAVLGAGCGSDDDGGDEERDGGAVQTSTTATPDERDGAPARRRPRNPLAAANSACGRTSRLPDPPSDSDRLAGYASEARARAQTVAATLDRADVPDDERASVELVKRAYRGLLELSDRVERADADGDTEELRTRARGFPVVERGIETVARSADLPACGP